MKKLGLLATVIAAIAFPAPPALATDDFVVAIRLVKTSEDFLSIGSGTGQTVIVFTSNFVSEINLFGAGPPVSVVLIPLSWQVALGGPATFDKVELKKRGFTKGVDGTLLTVGLNENTGPSECPGFFDGMTPPTPIAVSGAFTNVVCVPIELDILRCSGGSKLTGRGKVHVKLTLDVTFDGKTKPVGLGINLKLRDPDGCL